MTAIIMAMREGGAFPGARPKFAKPGASRVFLTIIPRLLNMAQLKKRPFFASGVPRHRGVSVELVSTSFCGPATPIDVAGNKAQLSIAVRELRQKADSDPFESLPVAADRIASVFRGTPVEQSHSLVIVPEIAASIFFAAHREDSPILPEPGKGQQEAYGAGAHEQIEVKTRPLGSVVEPFCKRDKIANGWERKH